MARTGIVRAAWVLLAIAAGGVGYAFGTSQGHWTNDLANGSLSASNIEHLPPGMDGFYRDAFDRRFCDKDEQYEQVHDVLGIMAAAREPLQPTILAGILGKDDKFVKSALALIPDFVAYRMVLTVLIICRSQNG